LSARDTDKKSVGNACGLRISGTFEREASGMPRMSGLGLRDVRKNPGGNWHGRH
jgi:hypothetical protein